MVTDSTGCRDTSLAYSYSIVPITLLNFTTAYNNSNATIVNWQTSQEINTSYFNVQKTCTLPHFITIKTLPAAGNSSITKNYTYSDKNILYQPTFYRLQQVDMDGKFTYSKTMQVYPSKNVFSINSIYPNPANNTLMVAFNSVSTNATTLLVTDMLGRVVQKNVLFPVAGFNKTDMNIALLAKGK